MDVHTGTWNIQSDDLSDLVFSSSAQVTVLITITKSSDPVLPVSVQLNGTVPPDGILNQGETARTFRFAAVRTIHIIAGSTPFQFVASGNYQITIL